METLTQTPTGNGAAPARLARKRFDPTQLFAQRDRLPWFWFFVAVAVTVLAALDSVLRMAATPAAPAVMRGTPVVDATAAAPAVVAAV